MKTRCWWCYGLAIVLVFAAAVGYTIVRLCWRERGQARAAPADEAPITAVGRPSASAPRARHLDEGPSERVAHAGPQSFAEELRSSVKGANIVICVLDAARHDHLSCYGYPRETTPNIDRLARQSLVFAQHFCQVPHTRPSTASLLTSQYPDTHNLFGRHGQLSPSTFTMESGLKAAGWQTAFFTSNVHASPVMGLGLDFDYRRGHPRSGGGGIPAAHISSRYLWGGPEQLMRQVSDWLEGGPRQPFFAYIHFRQPHFPYDPPKEMIELFAGTEPPRLQAGRGRPSRASGDGVAHADDSLDWNVNLYDANLRYADWAVGELEEVLRQHGVFDNTLFIVTSDHGELFGEHEHNVVRRRCPYDEAMHIPLVVKFPGKAGPVGSVGALTQTVDLLPTILDLFAIPYPREGVQGRSLLPLLTGEKEEVNEYVFARTDEGQPKYPASYVIRNLRWVLILRQGGRDRELYDIKADPGQTRNVIAEEPEQAKKMVRAFRLFAATQARPPLDFVDAGYTPSPQPKAPPVRLTEDMRRQLRALGYVD